jgi:glycosyltransferase involved in cell wall biosynthesis
MRISVVIPCYNVAQLLPRALDSVLAQDHDDLEVICVDDGSTDGTSALLQQYAERHCGLIQVLHQANLGASAARNQGMAASSGAYIQFLDADDTIGPGKLSGQVRSIADEGSPDLIVGDYETVMPNGLLLPVEALYDRAWMGLIKTRLGCTCSNLWKRQAVLDAGGWPEQLGSSQDYTLMFRMLRNNCTVAWDREARTVIHKRAAGSISQTEVRKNWDRYIDLRRDILQYLKGMDAKRYTVEIEAARQYIFMALRIVAKEDPVAARHEYARSIGRRFRPFVGPATTERYVLIHNLLGFATTERLLRMVQRMRS